MEKEKITFDQLAAGVLLKFGKLESADIALILKEISEIAFIEHNLEDDTDKYFLMSDGSVLLNEKYIHKIYGYMYDSLIKMVEGTVVEDYFSKLNITSFVLKKISLIGLGFVVKDGLRDVFSKRQLDSFSYLYDMRFIEDYMQEDSVYGDYEAIRVTRTGRLAIFLIDNKEDVKKFMQIVNNIGYGKKFINMFLMSQDLSKPCEEVLSVENFTVFCENYVSRKKDNCICKIKK